MFIKAFVFTTRSNHPVDAIQNYNDLIDIVSSYKDGDNLHSCIMPFLVLPNLGDIFWYKDSYVRVKARIIEGDRFPFDIPCLLVEKKKYSLHNFW
jgi:hypothetical protein